MVLGYRLMLLFCGDVYWINGFWVFGNLSLPVSVAGFILLILGIFQKIKIDLKSFGKRCRREFFYISVSWGLLLYIESHER